MESSYRIGRLKEGKLITDKNGRQYVDGEGDKEFVRYDDWGDFNHFLDRKLGETDIYHNTSYAGWAWVTDGKTVMKLLNEYRSKEHKNVFDGFECENPEDLYYIIWQDWS